SGPTLASALLKLRPAPASSSPTLVDHGALVPEVPDPSSTQGSNRGHRSAIVLAPRTSSALVVVSSSVAPALLVGWPSAATVLVARSGSASVLTSRSRVAI